VPVAAPPRVPQTAAYQGNPYMGNPNPTTQAPGAAQADSLNQALAGTGVSVQPGQVAGTPNADVLSGLLAGEVGPAIAGLQGQQSLLGAGQGLSQQQISDAMALQQQEAGFSLGQLGIQGANLGLQQQALQAQAGPGGFQEQQRALTAAEEAQQFAQSQRALRGQFATSGSTGGNQVQSWSDLLKGYGFQQQQLGLQAKEQQQAYQTSKAQLANAAKSLGLSEQEVHARLSNALDQLGLSGAMNTIGFMQQLAQLQLGFLSGPMAAIAQQVLQIAGLPVQAFAGGQ
jgi:hypothetical protein